MFLRAYLACALATVVYAADQPAIETYAGMWRGFQTGGEAPIEYRVQLTKKSKGLVGQALLWSRCGEAWAESCARGKKLPGTGLLDPSVAVEDVRVERNKDGIAFGGTRIQRMSGANWDADAIVLSEPEPGVLYGIKPTKDPERKSEFWLTRESEWQGGATCTLTPGQETRIEVPGGQWHYRVYVPKGYDHSISWPLIIHHSPGGDAAPYAPALMDELGWVSVGLVESKNGSWVPIVGNRTAALFDLHRKLNIDWTRVMFGGESGGARASSRSAIDHPAYCSGLFMIIAAWADTGAPAPGIPIFFVTGETDMNLNEVRTAFDTQKAAGRPVELVVHGGGHDDGGPKVIEQGLRWLWSKQRPAAPPKAEKVDKKTKK